VETSNYKPIKQNILANLEDLRDKVDYKRSTPQVVRLDSYYFDEMTQERYTLAVEVVTSMQQTENGLDISDIYIEEVHFFKNDGERPKFLFSKAELTDYIDF
jgi:hypothetical protein